MLLKVSIKKVTSANVYLKSDIQKEGVRLCEQRDSGTLFVDEGDIKKTQADASEVRSNQCIPQRPRVIIS